MLALAVVGVILAAIRFALLSPPAAQKQSQPRPSLAASQPSTSPVIGSSPGRTEVALPAVDEQKLISQVRAWLAEKDPDAQAALEQKLEALLTDTNAAQILQALPPDLLATPFAEAALRHWVHGDRRGAADWVAGQTGLTEPEQTAVIYGWDAEDKAGLNDYLDHLPAGEWKQNAMKFAASDALAAKSPQDAIALLVQMERTPARDDLMNWSATAWAQADSAGALRWASGLQDYSVRQSELGAVAVGLAWSDPQAATRLLAEQVQPGAVQDRSALSIACVWAQSDPQSAANWVAGFPSGELQQSVLGTLIQRWATQSVPAVQTWVNQLPPGSLHDAAASDLSQTVANLQREAGEGSAPGQ
ncbi:MAG: hypothetical protein QM796_15550 [Chthoniobacteraceae bacterium]